jgi:hypothetical protein
MAKGSISLTHIHDISNTYVPIPQLFAKGKSLKSEGIDMPRDKNKGLHVEPKICYLQRDGRSLAFRSPLSYRALTHLSTK